jgi:hypothetical protein
MARDFALCDLDGREERLRDYRGRMPVVIEFGSLSCPMVTGRSGQLDALAREYRGTAAFLFIYCNEEHPGRGETRTTSYGKFQALPQVRDRDDRRERARLFQSTVQTSRRVLVDEDGADSVAALYGIAGHGIVVVDAQGRIALVNEGSAGLPPDLDAAVGVPPPPRPVPGADNVN